MGTSFIPLCAIIAVLIIAFLFASLPQVSHKMRYGVLYAIAIIMLFAVIPISEYMVENTKKSNSNYLLVLISAVSIILHLHKIFYSATSSKQICSDLQPVAIVWYKCDY